MDRPLKARTPGSLLEGLGAVIASGKVAGAGTLAGDRGTTRMVVRGNPHTREPSSWTLYRWAGTGKNMPNSDVEFNDWQRLPSAEIAYRFGILPEHIKAFRKYRSGE